MRLAITNLKGGTGKTTTAVHLAAGLGRRVPSLASPRCSLPRNTGSAGRHCTSTFATILSEHDGRMGNLDRRAGLTRSGFLLEGITLGWNVVGIIILAIAAVAAGSVALAGFGLDSLIEIGASTVVIWELSGSNEQRQRVGMRLIANAFLLLAVYLAVQSTVVIFLGFHAHPSTLGIIWTGATAVVMFLLAAGKARVGGALQNRVLQTEGKVTLVDGLLATAVVLGLALNASLGWWWADPLAAYVLLIYAAKEGSSALRKPA